MPIAEKQEPKGYLQFLLKKTYWLFLIILISSCDNTPLVNISSEGLTEFHSEEGNWILSHKLLTEPQSTVADTIWLNVFSDDYRYLKEESLFTHFRNAEKVRILFSESFHNHTLFKFIKEDERVVFIEKELHQQIIYNKRDSSIFTMGYYKFNLTNDTIYEYRRIHGMQGSNIDEHVLIGEFDPIVSYKTRRISNSAWNALVNLVNSKDFRELPSTDRHCCSDGYNMTIEIHSANGYHLYSRQNPKDSVTMKIIQHLLKLSSNKNFIELHGS
ncbi:MAG: hypothetical protein RIC35_20635 [Marinoscillum sp.]